MSIPSVRPAGQDEGAKPGGPNPDQAEHSLAFAVWALLLTLGLLAGTVVAIWAAAGWPVGTP